MLSTTIRPLLTLLRTLLSRYSHFAYRLLLVLYRFTTGQHRGRKPDKGVPGDDPTSTSSVECRGSTSDGNIVICKSEVPGSVYLVPDSAALQDSEETFPQTQVLSIVAPTPRAAADTTLLHPYSFATHNASRSSQDIGLGSLSDRSSHHERFQSGVSLPIRPSSQLSSRPSTRPSSRQSSLSAQSANANPRHRSQLHSRMRAGLTSSPAGSRVNIGYIMPTTNLNRGPQSSTRSLRVSTPPPVGTSLHEKKRIYPVPSIMRYQRNVVIPKKPDGECIIRAMTHRFEREGIPPGWTACSHPEGALYFFHEARRIYTDAHLCDPSILAEIQSFIYHVDDLIQEKGIVLPPNAELVLELQTGDNNKEEWMWMYYFIHHSTRSLFWLEDFDFMDHAGFIMGELHPAHLHHEMERYYWLHWEMFPHRHKVSKSMLDEILSIALHAMGDQLTSAVSVVTTSVEELNHLIGIMKIAKELESNDHIACTLGRFMWLFAQIRFLNYHGQHGARICRNQSVHGSRQPRTLLIKLLSPFFFDAPKVHVAALEKIWIDQMMVELPWVQFIARLKTEWEEFTLYATVLLTANVSFLAIPSVDVGMEQRTPAQVASYASTIASTGSIIVGLLLLRQYKIRPRSDLVEAVAFLGRMTHPTRGVESLAILYSLPYALLMWGMIFFLTAFSLECFMTQDHAAIYAAAAAWIIVCIIIAWSIYHIWERSEDSIWWRIEAIWETKLTQLKRWKQSCKSKFYGTVADSSLTIATV